MHFYILVAPLDLPSFGKLPLATLLFTHLTFINLVLSFVFVNILSVVLKSSIFLIGSVLCKYIHILLAINQSAAAVTGINVLNLILYLCIYILQQPLGPLK